MSNNKLTILATGDLMLLQKFPKKYNYTEIYDFINHADVKITNLESVVSNWDCFASTFCGGQWINTESENLDDISKFNFNLYSCANNHSMDFSFDGLLSTKRELEKRNWIYAGIGESLDEASSAKIIEIPDKIKIGFISVTSTFIDAARAGNSRDEIPSRPGVNPLRVKTKYLVNKKHFDDLTEIAENTYINGERDNARKIGSLPPEEKNSINFGGNFFVVSENGKEGKYTYCHKGDLSRILEEIKKVKDRVDYVVMSVHSHQIKRTSYTEPDYFLEEFAHKCVDAGVSAVVCGGTHQLKPIEIYHEKPIFYSLGNFIFQNHLVKKLPADFWDKYSYDVSLTVQEGMNIKTQNGTIGLEQDKNNYVSVIPMIEFEGEKLSDIVLLPIELNFDNEYKGLPRIADEKDIRYIFEYLSDISSAYNTKLILDDLKFIKVEI